MAGKLPNPVRVGHVRYEVRYEKGLSSTAGAAGVCGTDTQTVLIDPDLGPDATRETVLHELLHALVDYADLDVRLADVEKALEERVVNSLAPVLLAALRDNPTLVKFLVAS